MPKPKDGRARRTIKACVICHKKKVRCDIDEVEGGICTPCQRDAYECVPRERKRKRFTFSPSPPSGQTRVHAEEAESTDLQEIEQTPPSADTSNHSTTADHNYTLTSDAAANGHDHGLNSRSDLENPGMVSILNNQLYARVSHPGYLPRHHSVSTEMLSSSEQRSRNVSYLGRLEYLRGEVPVNDEDGIPEKVPHRLSKSDIEILHVQRVTDLPPRAIRESLLDAFWTRCYPWTPVVERSWIYGRRPGKVSLLLQHAMLLAGSRVSAPMADYPSEEFYKKARVLFWMSAEQDSIVTIASACLLHWWNPQGPEQISLDTSSFWLRVCVGLAHQVGLHREPTGKLDAGLRRRIWWSLAVRDCLINAGHGRPRAINLKLADVAPISNLDFDGSSHAAELFSAYVDISCILGDLTQSYLWRHGLQEHRKALENRLFRWLKTLPTQLQLCEQIEGRPLKPYSFEARQIHVQYFTVLIILNRPADPKLMPSTASLLASSYVAGLFEDFIARDELRYLGPIFTFYCLTAGMTQLSCYRYSDMVHLAEENLGIVAQALEELSERWPTAIGSLKHLMDVREKVMQRPHSGQFSDTNFQATRAQFFSDFGPDLCRMWHRIHQRLSHIVPVMASIQQGLRTPNNQPPELDMATNSMEHPMMNNDIVVSGSSLEPTLLQPQEWFEPYSMGNWLTVDWEQELGW